MKYHRLAALFAFVSLLGIAHAQEEEKQRGPSVEIPDFSNLDEYIYEPKSTVKLGFRNLSGAKVNFSGQGTIPTPETYDPNQLGPNVAKYYRDGTVLPDTRTTPQLDSSGNPMIDPQTGTTQTARVPNDGKTNSWGYGFASQVDNAPLGYIAFHSYSAAVTDTATRNAKSRSTSGLDLTVSRDMGTLLGGKITWGFIGGLSVNDISAKKNDRVAGLFTTYTDLYSLLGANAPAAGYDGTSGSASGSLSGVVSSSGTSSVSTDGTALLANEPSSHDKSTKNADTGTAGTDVLSSITDTWKLKGAYYTFRGGAEMWYVMSSRFRAGVSFGAAVVYSGTHYSVTQVALPDTGNAMTTVDTESVNKLLPGYFADATLQFDITEKTGFFAGAVFQSATSYTQSLNSTISHYAAKVDLSNQNGVRAGMSIRF